MGAPFGGPKLQRATGALLRDPRDLQFGRGWGYLASRDPTTYALLRLARTYKHMALFNLKPKVLIGVGALVALLALGLMIPQCHAAPLDAPYVQLSGGTSIVRGPAPAADISFTEESIQLRKAYWQESLTVIGTSTLNGKPVPNNFVARILFVDGFGAFDVGLGLSWMQNPAPYNGSPVNFALQLAYRFRSGVTLTYAHLSNAGSREPNLGRDLVFIGWRFH